MFALMRFECLKLVRQRKTLAGLAVILLLNLLFAVAFILRQRHPGRAHHDLPQELLHELFNAFVYTVTILAPAAFLLFPMLLAILGAYLLAGEIELGSLRLMLARPVPRWQIYLAKFGAVSLLAAVLLATLLVTSYAVSAVILRPAGDLIVFGPMFGLPRGIIVHAREAAPLRLLAAYTLAWPMLVSVGAMTLMFAVITRHFTSAAILTTTVYFCSYVVGGIPLLSAVHPFLPTRYLPFWKYVLLEQVPWATLGADALGTLAYLCAFLAVGISVFNARDY